MSAATLSPPRPPVCLTRSYKSRGIKGGTVIAEDVLDFGEHLHRFVDPDRYRAYVDPCPRCGARSPHAHCFRERRLRSQDAVVAEDRVTIRLYRCASLRCRAVFTVLPAFVARNLWRAWKTVDDVVAGRSTAARSTARRWLVRLRSDASQLLRIVAATVTGDTPEILIRAGPRTRGAFVDALQAIVASTGNRFALAAAWVHRLEAGIRIM